MIELFFMRGIFYADEQWQTWHGNELCFSKNIIKCTVNIQYFNERAVNEVNYNEVS